MKKVFFTLLFTYCATQLLAQIAWQGQAWQKWSGSVPAKGTRAMVVPQKEDIYMLSSSLKSQLSSLPSNAEEGQVIALPSPDGTFRSFKAWKETTMEEGLANKYPQIETFSGVATDDPTTTVKMDYTVFGFHAMVSNGKTTYLIDPYSNEDDGFYTCYYKHDFKKPANLMMPCGVDDGIREIGEALQLTDNGLPAIRLRINGTVKRTFRLALACTGEYAVAVAGANPTKAAVLSQMVTSMNRVNQVYERELGVHMNLIANEDTLIFLDGVTDPYANNNGGSMLSQNQTTVNSRIGSANYDIGHVFSTGGGGIAILGCVCNNFSKAKGVTGQSMPVGDPFDIDYVAHEMGHQFGADHTFNANTGSCSGNGEPTQAYEPGSGTTIMAYAGICGGGNDFQQHSDDYFHAISLLRINTLLTGSATCGTSIASGNTPPVVAPFNDSFIIPANTPFEITAPQAQDIDHDTLTYCWEEWDLGDFAASWNNIRLYGPIFRSFPPDTGRTRTFPNMAKLVAGITNYPGEKLPDTARSLNFRLTIRDIFNGTGTFNSPEDLIHVDVVVPPSSNGFEVTAPATQVNWGGNTNNTITWDVAGTDLLPVNCPTVDIYLSDDGGMTYPYLLKSNTPNDGSESVLIPNLVTTNQARIKVKASNNIFFNINPVDFTITHTSGIQQISWHNDVNIFPVPASKTLHITSTNNMKYEVQITNVVGQKLFLKLFSKQLEIPVENFADGVYYLQMTDAVSGEKLVRPIVIE
ncbi:MAG TPA: zinc-dependent metalloprotease family protein [Flavipsychrobacter sp.]|nr:zinc-dependent metalloprotease family protein [Flavipsychrobacter sp.]